MGQLATNQNTRPAGALPSDREKNPQVSAITLRTGRELEEVPKKRKDKPIPEGELIPKATQEANKDDTVLAPIQLVDAILDITKYAKYIKDTVANKRRLTEFETVALTEECTSRDSLEKAIVLFESLDINDEVEEMKHILNASCEYMKGSHPFEPLNMPNGPPPKPSIEEAPKLELNPLPSHLHYTYLGSSDTLPVIISSDLSELQEEKLLRVLRKLKRVIGWTMSNIRGTSTAFCMHKILMEEGHKPRIEQQRCLNPNMKEVVRKEVIKWLDADGYSGYNQIVIALEDQEKTTFTCPYGTYAFKRMPFGLCNAPVTFQRLLEKDTSLKFDDACLKEFDDLKRRLATAPIIIALDWKLPFELMCDASDIAIGAVLGLENRGHVTEGESIKETFTDEHLLAITSDETSWYADYVNFNTSGVTPPEFTNDHRRRFLHDVRFYMWDEPFLYKQCAYQLVRRCFPEEEMNAILHDYYASLYGGHHGGDKTAQKVLQSGFYWPKLFKDAHAFIKNCDKCQRTVDCVSKWVEAIVLPTNDAKVVVLRLTKWRQQAKYPNNKRETIINNLLKSLLAVVDESEQEEEEPLVRRTVKRGTSTTSSNLPSKGIEIREPVPYQSQPSKQRDPRDKGKQKTMAEFESESDSDDEFPHVDMSDEDEGKTIDRAA
ncbi:uncharacterized protein [Nicotiana sylvestris]|uniref:uncharacterized protein n=1 Tax=Nicotiana sylvestris TaxID=4096 RepID=UPI00388CE3B4